MNATQTSEMLNGALIDNPQVKREADRSQANREELTERIAQAIHQDGTIEPLKGLHFNRVSSPSECVHSVSIPAFCVIAQGSKEVFLGSDRYQYDPMHYLLATVELPIVSQTESKAVGCVRLLFWAATRTTSPERSIACGKTLTSRCGSKTSPKSLA